tara:strand:+ start:3451 stop:3573 length:123 start_codon:yes stop_codon:yes gene_type:complete
MAPVPQGDITSSGILVPEVVPVVEDLQLIEEEIINEDQSN